MSTSILTEDEHGVLFFENLVSYLKSANIVPSGLKVKVQKYNEYKLPGMLKVTTRDYDQTIVVIDCDGECGTGNSRLYLDILAQINSGKVKGVKIDTEIEEWVCISKGLSFHHEKPSHVLKTQEGYRKRSLPRYGANLNIDVLLSKSVSFSELISLLR